MNRAGLQDALSHGNVRAFLAVIDLGEHGPHADDPDRYRTLYGGGKFDAPPWRHPRRKVTAAGITSTAAGRGQFLAGTWDSLAGYGFPDFSPECQDEAMVALIYRRKALADVIAGRFDDAIAKCCREWASLPGSPYGQPVLTMAQAKARYQERGGAFFNPDSLESEHYGDAVTEAPMAPLILPLLQVAAQFLPQLAEKFGSGSEVANRNLAAGKVLAEAITTATSSPNLQAAVEKMAADPEAVKAATVAVAQEWPDLFEVGGGIVEARKAAYSPEQVPWWKNPAIIIALAILPLVYMVAVAVLFGVGGQPFSDDIKTLLVTAIVTGALGSITGFFLGSSLGSQSKDNRARAFVR